MNAMTKIQKMNWAKYPAHQWLEQYGLWVRSTKMNVSANPLAIAIDQNDKTRLRPSRVSMPCEISDFEGVEVCKVLAKMHNDSREYLAERAWLLILKYENGWSDRVIGDAHGVSRAYVRAEVANGLAYLNGLFDAMAY